MTEVNEVAISRGGKMAEGGGGGMGRLIKIILIVVILLVLIAGGVVAAFWFMDTGGEPAATAGAAADGVQTSYIENPQYLDLGTFVVNLADGRRYLKTSLQLLLDEEQAKEFLSVREAEVKDLVVAELQTLNAEQLRDPKERELLKQRLIRKISSLLPVKGREWDDPAPIKKVLITEFYLQ